MVLSPRTISQCFEDFDSSKTGMLSRRDFEFALTALVGLRPSKTEVGLLLGDQDHVTLSQFLSIVNKKYAVIQREDLIRQMFCAFDVGCRGFLSIEDVLSSFEQVFPSVSHRVVYDAFKAADRDGDSRVGYYEFVRITQGVLF